jgi:hypothetical protein
LHPENNITSGEGRGNAFIVLLKKGRIGRLLKMLKTPEKIQELRKKLYQKAKQEKGFRFYALYDKVYRKDIIELAYRLVKFRKGAPGIDGITFEDIEEGMEGGATRYCEEIAGELRNKTYTYLYENLGLYKIPTTAPWRLTANVAGKDDWKAVFGSTERTV